MTDLLDDLEARRLALGLSQKAVAADLSISQPHYSKVIGGLAALTPAMERTMIAWLDGTTPPAASAGPRKTRIRSLTRAIQRQLRELNALIDEDGVGRGRRRPKRTRRA